MSSWIWKIYSGNSMLGVSQTRTTAIRTAQGFCKNNFDIEVRNTETGEVHFKWYERKIYLRQDGELKLFTRKQK